MLKKVLFIFCTLLLIPTVFSLNVTVEKVSDDVVYITNLNEPIYLQLNVTNHGEDDVFGLYNLLGFRMTPEEKFSLKSKETKTIDVVIYPRENFNYEGYYVLRYSIGNEEGDKKDLGLTINFVNLDEVFDIGQSQLDPSSNTIKLSLINKVNYGFKDVKGEFYSDFFKFDKTFDIGPIERKEFVVTLNKEDYKKLMAGFYTLEVDLNVKNESTRIKGTIKFDEKDILTSYDREWGLFVNTKVIRKTNEGNIPSPTTTQVKKNIISRLFTSFSPKPDYMERKGSRITYTWNSEIAPGEFREIRVKTNWFFPFIIVLFIVIITIGARRYSQKPLQITKTISYVRTRGGEFALKVTLKLKSRNELANISVIDKIPPLMKLYNRMGIEAITSIDEKNRKIEWDFKSLSTGETRVISYVVYSKMGVLGKFALPCAAGLYEHNGKIHEVYSNKAFFVAEQQVGAERD
ncbi:hypothetical protein COU57_01755 [Candidatus Pacearchaeota archaeon CG10_big_fil_rev_8_21_14_0_10_32_14]|nr:MAG: hypothetical protein COU57_01755 [Candidatus Pacearchaeota archaeon CG10_big_fil_rev_8_21_14_0_10_32_14]